MVMRAIQKQQSPLSDQGALRLASTRQDFIEIVINGQRNCSPILIFAQVQCTAIIFTFLIYFSFIRMYSTRFNVYKGKSNGHEITQASLLGSRRPSGARQQSAPCDRGLKHARWSWGHVAAHATQLARRAQSVCCRPSVSASGHRCARPDLEAQIAPRWQATSVRQSRNAGSIRVRPRSACRSESHAKATTVKGEKGRG